MKKRVVITGGGIVSALSNRVATNSRAAASNFVALGDDWPVILENLKAGKNFVRRMDEWNRFDRMNTRLAVPVDFEMPDYPRKKIRGMGRVSRLALAATDKALTLAGLAESPELSRGRCGVAYGSSTGSVDSLLDFYMMLISNDMKNISATTYIRSMPQSLPCHKIIVAPPILHLRDGLAEIFLG